MALRDIIVRATVHTDNAIDHRSAFARSRGRCHQVLVAVLIYEVRSESHITSEVEPERPHPKECEAHHLWGG